MATDVRGLVDAEVGLVDKRIRRARDIHGRGPGGGKRDGGGKPHVFLNVCQHRGNAAGIVGGVDCDWGCGCGDSDCSVCRQRLTPSCPLAIRDVSHNSLNLLG